MIEQNQEMLDEDDMEAAESDTKRQRTLPVENNNAVKTDGKAVQRRKVGRPRKYAE